MEIWEEIKVDSARGTRRLVAECWGRLNGAALAVTKDDHAAEDLVFRTFARVVAKIDQYDESMPFWNWMYAIMLNFFRSDLRKMKAEVAETADYVEETAATGDGAGDGMQRLSPLDAGLVRKAVSSLSPTLRETVMLRYYEDMTLQEMAEVMAVPLGSVKSRHNLARKALRCKIEETFNMNGKNNSSGGGAA